MRKSKHRRKAIFGILTAGIFIIVMFIGMMLPPKGSCRQKARRIQCAHNLKTIYAALKIYAEDNKRCFPNMDGVALFETLRKKNLLLDMKSLVCPSGNERPALPNHELTDENISYQYAGKGLTLDEPFDKILLFDKQTNHRYYGNVLYVDGVVKGFLGGDWLEKAAKKEELKTDAIARP